MMHNHWHLDVKPHEEGEFDGVRNSVKRGSPYGTDSWCEKIVKTLNFEITVNHRGRPRIIRHGS